MRRFLALLGLTLALASGLTLATPAPPAHASETDSIDWLTGMPGCGDIATPTSGGWTGNRYFVSQRFSTFSDAYHRPVFLRLDEPCALNNSTLGVRYYISAPSVWPSFENGNQGGPGVAINNNGVRCYNSSGALITTGSYGYYGLSYNTTTYQDNSSKSWTINTSSCVRLHSIEMQVTVWDDPRGTQGTSKTYPVTWTATRAIAETPYGGPSGDAADDIEGQCDDGVTWVWCDVIATPSPTDWEDTCGDINNASYYGVEWVQWNPVDGATWGPALSWTLACMFVPLGGFDRNFELTDAAEAHPNAAVINGYTTIATAFQMNGSCGVLLDATGTVLDGFRLDSCTWSWAAPWRELLAIVGFAMLAWWALSYIVNSSFAVMNKKIVLPWQDAKGSGI